MDEIKITREKRKRFAKIRALTVATNLLEMPERLSALTYEFEANQYTTEEDRKLIRKELEAIKWQLRNRLIKLEMQAYA